MIEYDVVRSDRSTADIVIEPDGRVRVRVPKRLPDEKIRVVPNAVGDEFTREGPVEAGDYVLAVGTLEPRKNLARTIEATARLGVELRVAGQRGWGGVEPSGNETNRPTSHPVGKSVSGAC